ncbi:MAG: hypothetical protein AAFX94_01185, partial [Myxococcota bacterium]
LEIPTGDIEDLVFFDFIPALVFTVPSGTPINFDLTLTGSPPTDLPDANEARWGPNTAWSLLNTATEAPTITVVDDNEVEFDFRSLALEDSGDTTAGTIEILYTFAIDDVVTAPDNYRITNLLSGTWGSSVVAPTVQASTTSVARVGQPVIVPTVGVVSVGSTNGALNFDPAVPTAPADLPFDSDVADVDAGDVVNFALTLENIGSADGFFVAADLNLEDFDRLITGVSFESLSVCSDDLCTDSVTYTQVSTCSAPLQNTFSTARFSPAGGWIIDVCFIDSDDDETAGGPLSGESVVARFSATLDSATSTADTPEINARDAFSVRADVTWTNTETNTDRTDAVSDAASVTVRDVAGTAAVTATSKPETTATRLAVGEDFEITYTISVPEGENDLSFSQTVPDRIAYDTAGTVTISRAGNTQLPACIEAATATPSGSGLDIDWSGSCTVQNPADGNADNDFFTVTVPYVTPDVSANTNPGNFVLGFTLATDGIEVDSSRTLEGPRLRIVVPDIEVATSFSQATGLDAESTTDVTLTVSQGNTVNQHGPLFETDVQADFPKAFFSLGVGTVSGSLDGGGSVSCAVTDSGLNWRVTCTDVFTVNNNQARSITFSGVEVTDTVPTPARVQVDTAVGGVSCTGPGGRSFALGTWTGEGLAETRGPSVAVTVVSTSQAATSGQTLLIGESVTFRAVVTLPPGVANDLAVLYELPAGSPDDTFQIVSAQLNAGLTTVDATAGVPSAAPGETDSVRWQYTSVTSSPGSGDKSLVVDFIAVPRLEALPPPPATASNVTPDAHRFSGRVDPVLLGGAPAQGSDPACWDLSGAPGSNPDDCETNSVALSTPVVQPELVVTKTFQQTDIQAGERTAVTVRVQNTGDAPLFEIVLTDDLTAGGQDAFFDAGTVQVGSAGSDYPAGFTPAVASGVLTYTQTAGEGLAAGATAEFTFSLEALSSLPIPSSATNVAVANGTSLPGTLSGGDPLFGREQTAYSFSGAAVVAGSAAPTLSVATSTDYAATSDTAGSFDGVVGETVTYTFTLTFPDGVTADPILAVPLPPGLSVTDVTVVNGADLTVSGAPAITPTAPGASGADVEISWAGQTVTNPPGTNTGSPTITVTVDALIVDVAETREEGEVLSVTGELTLSDSSTRSANAETLRLVEPDVAIEKRFAGGAGESTLARDGVTPDSVTFELIVSVQDDDSDAPAHDIEVTDTIPAELLAEVQGTDTSGGGDAGSASIGAGNVLRWTVPGPLAPGETATLTYTAEFAPAVTIAVAGPLVNRATLDRYGSRDGPDARAIDPATDGFDNDGDSLIDGADSEEAAQATVIPDSDGDGIADEDEATLGTDPFDIDSDDDGIPDGLEVPASFRSSSDGPYVFAGVPEPVNPAASCVTTNVFGIPCALDVDNDGLPNALDPDSDNDGLGDGVEVGNDGVVGGTNPLTIEDPDGDGPILGTDPNSANFTVDADAMSDSSPYDANTDDDCARDGQEDLDGDGQIVTPPESDPSDGMDPLVCDASTVDSDGDGLADTLEQVIGTDPFDYDSD